MALGRELLEQRVAQAAGPVGHFADVAAQLALAGVGPHSDVKVRNA